MNELRGKLALVTGASRGIGAELARALASRGMRVLLNARSEEALIEVAQELRSRGAEAHTLPGDVTDGESASRAHPKGGSRTWRLGSPGEQRRDREHRTLRDPLRRRLGAHTRRKLAGAHGSDSPGVARHAIAPPRSHPQHRVHGGACGGGSRRKLHHHQTRPHRLHALAPRERAEREDGRERLGGVPAFVEDTGIYTQWKTEHGARTSSFFRAISARDVVAAALRAVQYDLPDVLVAPGPMRLALAMATLAPRLGETVGHIIGSHDVFTQVAQRRQQ